MSEVWVRHSVLNMNDTMVQKCIACGEIICDFRNTMIAPGGGIISGFAEGSVYKELRLQPDQTFRGIGNTTIGAHLKKSTNTVDCCIRSNDGWIPNPQLQEMIV